ncbi:MAG: EAL domain-containing protein [Acidobacteriota bacterium]
MTIKDLQQKSTRNEGTEEVQVSQWLLEGFFDGSGRKVRTAALDLPCRIGRNGGLGITFPFASISSEHAELYLSSDQLFVRDLGSTNGTFVNHRRVDRPTPCDEGDILHFGRLEVRLVREDDSVPDKLGGGGTVELHLSHGSLPNQLLLGTRQLHDLLKNRRVLPHFQPIVCLQQRERRGFEILGRGAHSDLPRSPSELFKVAEEVGKETDLSAAFRDIGTDEAPGLDPEEALYLNTHPAELRQPDELLASLAALRERHPSTVLVLEVHESAALDASSMKLLRNELRALDIELAYDDFGVGQSRLAELLEVPPEVVKFDMAIVRGLHVAASSKVSMVGSLVEMLHKEGISCLAEGIETELEARACAELGFDLAQGYLFGRPEPASAWAN